MASPERVCRWQGLRQDSGDPFAFAPQVQDMYRSLGIDYQSKKIIYSDGLDVEKCLKLKGQCDILGIQGIL
jgi:nicotinate phosphoribosyltransferase